ncbi:DsbA family protein [Agrobacterium tumefaciens]|uniref:DsbA family protein n=1 Tax=Agrobacterium tumefaciens TaxID=358 RepID=UPI0034577918
MTDKTQITYLFDPLCGWCYGASPLLAQLDAAPGLTVVPIPTGLFSGTGARVMDASFAAYAWSNDERIASMTGQPFTEDYRSGVLAKGGMMNSGPATLALSAVALTAPQRELDALCAIQEARYVKGLDVTSVAVLVTVLEGLGLEAAASHFVSPAADLMEFHKSRLVAAQTLMREFAVQGVPGVIVDDGSRKTLLRSQELFGDGTVISRLIRSGATDADGQYHSNPATRG